MKTTKERAMILLGILGIAFCLAGLSFVMSSLTTLDVSEVFKGFFLVLFGGIMLLIASVKGDKEE